MKKLVSILATLVLALQLTTAYAAGTPVVTMSSETGVAAGDEVELYITMENVAEWTNVNLEVDYDTTALTLTGVSNLEESGATFTKSKTIDVRPYNISWNAMENSDYNGDMLALTFEVSEDAADGEYAVTVDFYKGKKGNYKDGNQVNYVEDLETFDSTPLGLTYVCGSITVGEVGPTLSAAKDGDTVTITATGEMVGKFIVAGYNADGLTKVVVLDAAATATAEIADADNVKVMWWDSLTGLNSIAPAVSL